MRYSLEHKARNHQNILSKAARSFRENGADTSGIGTVMKQAGLTKGGFYRHFQSKDDLLVEAVVRAFEEMGNSMVEVAQGAPEGHALRAMIEHYLSDRHAKSPGVGCVVSVLGPELARKPIAVRRRIEASLEAYRERLVPFIPGRTHDERVQKCKLLFSSMAGVLMTARFTSDTEAREQLLKQARTFFVGSFAKP